MSEPLVIGPGTEVTLHFSLRLESGDVVEDTRQYEKPAQFLVGDGQIMPGFERKLHGLVSGLRRSFVIAAKDAFGTPKADNIQTHKKAMLGDLTKDAETFKPGLVVGFKDTQGQEVPGVIKEVHDEQVVIDFNHPLAGQDLIFDVEIIDVQAAPSPVTIQPASSPKPDES